MIYEVAITPGVFGASHSEQPRFRTVDLLRELFFPIRSPENVFLADLADPAWRKKVTMVVSSLPPGDKLDAMKLLEQLYLLKIVSVDANRQVGVHSNWIRLALSEPWKDRLHAVIAEAGEVDNQDNRVVCVERLADVGWVADFFDYEQTVHYTVENQTQLVRKFCRVSDWLIVTVPITHGQTSRDELATVLAIVRTALSESTSCRRFTLEVVLGCKSEHYLANAIKLIQVELLKSSRSVQTRSVCVNIYHGRDLLNRTIMGGVFKRTNENPEKRVVRFGLTPSHIADRLEKHSPRKEDKETWTLHRKNQAELERWEDFFASQTPKSIFAGQSND